jgi:DNA-binding transcriptional MerR regulator
MTDAAERHAEAGSADDLAPEARREKSPQAFRTISEVSEELDIPPHVLRFWESKFPQLNPLKRGGGRRYYRPADVALLRGIQALLYDEGLTIKGLQKVFRERGARHVVAVGDGAEPAPPPEGDDAPDAPAAVASPDLFPPAPAEMGARLAAVVAALEGVRDRLRRG